MAKSWRYLNRHWALATIVLISAGILLGQRQATIITDCDEEELHALLVAGSFCGAAPTTESLERICDCEIEIVYNAAPAPVASNTRLSFEYNLGQADPRYSFVTRISARETALLRSDEAVISGGAALVKARFENARADASPEPSEPLEGRVNYFLGNRPEHWVTDVPTFRAVTYRDVYPGIDVKYYGQGSQLEHDFIVRPGADPSRIRFRFEGAEASVNNAGDVVLRAGGGRQVYWKKPHIQQMRTPGKYATIEGRYRISPDGGIGFEVGTYDPGRPLVIDPVIAFSTYIGSEANDAATRSAVDPSGNVYITGRTANIAYPVTPGLPQPVPSGPSDSSAIVSKFRPDGTGLVYSTMIGGAATELGLGIATDAAGNAYVAGYTNSGNFPVTNGAYRTRPIGPHPQPSHRGDCFVLKLNPAGNALSYSTYLSGGDSDGCTSLAIDAAGNAYVAGFTRSAEFPRTEQAFQLRFNIASGGHEGFVAKLNPTGSALVYSSLIGGSGYDVVTGIAVDSSGAAYVTGITTSNDLFPASLAGGFQPRRRSVSAESHDAFAAKVNPDGTALIYGTYLGGTDDDLAFGIAVDTQGGAVICGNTMSADFPVGNPSYQASYRGAGGQTAPLVASGDAFVTKLNSTGSALSFSTYLGGSRDDRAMACGLDPAGRVMVTGYTLSTDFPITGDAAQPVFGGIGTKILKTGDAFFVQLAATGTSLLYSTYLGGSADELAVGLTVDGAGASYVAGGTGSENFLTTSGVMQTASAGTGMAASTQFPYGEGFVTKFGPADGSGNPGTGPSIAFIGSSASYAGGSVAPGEIVVLTGSSIGPAQLSTAVLATPDSLSTSVGETRILFDGVAAPIVYVSAGQSAVVVPYGVAGRPNTVVQAEYRGVRSPSIPVPVIAVKPALFTANASGRGPAAALNQDNSFNASIPAAQGTVLVLYGTGSGVTQPASVDGRLAINVVPRIPLPVSVSIAGITAEPLYAGAAPSLVAGVFQINVTVPSNAPSGNQPIVVRIGDSSSQSGVTVSIR